VDMYVSPTQTRTVTCYVTGQYCRQGGRPTTKKNASWPNPNSGHESQRGSMSRRTDWLTVSCKVTMIETEFSNLMLTNSPTPYYLRGPEPHNGLDATANW